MITAQEQIDLFYNKYTYELIKLFDEIKSSKGDTIVLGKCNNNTISEFVDLMGVLTNEFGYECVIEDIHMNLWKERIWSLIENAGLLPEIAWRGDKEKDRLQAEKDYYEEEEYDFPEEEPTDLDSNKHINIFE